MQEQDWDRMINGLRSGDDEACAEFWGEYGTMLEAVAQKQLSQKLQRRVGSDDVVQSACRTFFRRVSAGQFELPDADALWRLMCAITLTKARRAARDHTRQKRGIENEQYIDASAADGSSRAFQLPGGGQTPLDAAAFSDQMQTLLASLEPNECQVLDLKLQQNTNEEIAEVMGCSERTVRRITNQIRERWTNLFDAEE
ncbi:MAG: RNA polymerase sigma factor [Pirellulaceae bacterium]